MKSILYPHIVNYMRIKMNLTGSRSSQLKGKTVVFNSARVTYFSLHAEMFLAHLLARQGAAVYLLLDDGLLKHWDTKQFNHTCDWRTPFREKSISALKHMWIERLITGAYKDKNLKIIRYSQIGMDQLKPDILCEYAHHAKNSWIRYFQTEPEDASYQQNLYFQDSLINCGISYSIGNYIINELKPDLFVTSHGILSVWGPCFDLIRSHNISALVWCANVFSEKSIRFCDQPMVLQSKSSDWHIYKNLKLRESQKRKVEEYLNTRLIRSSRDTQMYYGSYKTFRKISVNKKNNLIIGLFPNVLWDNNIEDRNTIFKGILDWLLETIRIIRQNDYRLIIRFHPSENTIMKKDNNLELLLRKQLPEIDNYKKIELISSADNVNTYDLFEFIDIGIVYSGTLAMEMVYKEIPVISCARGVYHGTGFAFEPETIEEYTDQIKNIHRLKLAFKKNGKLIREKLLHFAHWYFFVNDYHLPIMASGYPPAVDFAGLSKNQLDPSANPDLKKTLDKIKTFLMT